MCEGALCEGGVSGGLVGCLLQNVSASETSRLGVMFFSVSVSLKAAHRLACRISPVKLLKGNRENHE